MIKFKTPIILFNLILLLAFFNWNVYQKEKIINEGQLVLLRLAPVDPRSLMQGDYMRLNYELTSSLNLKNDSSFKYAIVSLDAKKVANFIRTQENLDNINSNEIPLKLKMSGKNYRIGAESYFFEEGKSKYFEKAKYGGIKIDTYGNSILIGLFDENQQFLDPLKATLNKEININ